MSSASKLALLGLVLAPLIGRAQTDSGPWRFIPPNAKALISIDWSRVRKSHVGTLLREKWVDDAGVPGSEFLDEADRFVISSTGRAADQPDAEAPMLIVVAGHFDLAKVRTALAQHRVKPQMYNSLQVYRQQGKDAKDLAFALLNPQTILLGDSRSVFASLDRSAFPAAEPAAGSLLARVADMDASYDAWAIVNTPDILGGDRLTALLSGADSDVEARGFEFGVSLRTGLAADIALTFGSDAVAKSMATELSRITKLVVKDKLGDPALADLEKKLKFAAQGSVAKLTLRLTPQEFEKNAQIFAASRKQPAPGVADIRPVVKAQQPVAARIEPTVPPKPEKKVIRIEGLDDGPREIPYQENH